MSSLKFKKEESFMMVRHLLCRELENTIRIIDVLIDADIDCEDLAVEYNVLWMRYRNDVHFNRIINKRMEEDY